MKMRRKQKEILIRIGLCLVLGLILFVLWLSNYRKNRTSEINLKSRYTFSIRIDENGNLYEDQPESNNNHTSAKEFANIGLNEIADLWLKEFTNQFTQKYIPYSKSLGKIQLSQSKVLDESTNTVLVSFSAVVKDKTSGFFSSWDGITDEGRLKCEWVISYNIEDHYDGTATVNVSSILSSEEYGISQYNESVKSQVTGDNAKSDKDTKLTKYEIKDNSLAISYDGGTKFTNVPMDCRYLPFAENSNTELQEGSYVIDATKTVFIYGGMEEGNSQIPITILFSNDKGASWTNAEIDKIYDASYYYVNFFDEQNGVIVVGYSKNNNQESSRIYRTSNGGESWTNIGSGPSINVIKGVEFIDNQIGFFCYDYVDGMESNLYMTKDAGKSFSKIVFDPQELDSTAANAVTDKNSDKTTEGTTAASDGKDSSKLTWNDVYKEALVPILGNNGELTVYLTQGSNGAYNNGKTAAKYLSQDKGETWKYIGQFDLNAN